MERRSSIVGGMILILVGTAFLLLQMFPDLAGWFDWGRQWPLITVAIGGFFLLGALFGTPPLAVPGSIIAGIGAILYYQNLTGNWASWAYVWTLIPGFAGTGLILMGLLDRKARASIREGSRLLAVSLVLFVIFGAFFSGFGGLGRFWPVVLILVGAWLLLKRK